MPLSPADYDAAAQLSIGTVTLSCSVKRTIHDQESDQFRTVETHVGWTFKTPPATAATPEIAHALYVLHMPRLFKECYSALAPNEVISFPEAKRLIDQVETFFQRVRTPKEPA